LSILVSNEPIIVASTPPTARTLSMSNFCFLSFAVSQI
jgi:hypothetical protein